MADHENAAIKHNDHLLLDQPLLRLPHELLRKNFRSAHLVLEKDTTALKTQLKDAANAAVSSRATPQEVVRSLDAMLTRMRGTKRKLEAHAEEEARLHGQTAARIAHLDELYGLRSTEEPRYEAWSRRRLDRLLADYLLRRGYVGTARALAADKAMEALVDVDTFVAMGRVRSSLLAGRVTEALAWCAENKKELRRMESPLEFMLRLQQYVEMVRSESGPRLVEAIAHARKYLMPLARSFPREMRQASGLLAIPPSSPSARTAYGDLYRPSRWGELADLFVDAHNALLALPSVPLLHIALSSGLSALKTPACHSASRPEVPVEEEEVVEEEEEEEEEDEEEDGDQDEEEDEEEVTQQPAQEVPRARGAAGAGLNPVSSLGHGVCPICSTELNDLARNVPYAHHTKSYVPHDLYLLPNGRVYGREQLLEQAKKAGLAPGMIRNQLTGEIVPLDHMKRVYIT